jgi:hypothetical protein
MESLLRMLELLVTVSVGSAKKSLGALETPVLPFTCVRRKMLIEGCFSGERFSALSACVRLAMLQSRFHAFLTLVNIFWYGSLAKEDIK